MLSTNLLTFAVLLLFPLLSSANWVDENRQPLNCRNMRTFPFVSCQPECTTYSLDVHRQCQTKQQFGCLYRRCSAHNFQCALGPQTASNTVCPNNEVQVREVTLRPNFPVEFDLAVGIKGDDLDVLLLIDASESTRPRLDAVKNELSSLVSQLNGNAHVGVAVYGGENSFDDKGMQVVSPVGENVQSALNALDNLPTFPDGPRTTLTALDSVKRYPDHLSLRRCRRIVVLIGDTPGREPECSFQHDRNSVARSFIERFPVNLTYLIPASLGGQGLDAALPPIPPCANGSGGTESQAVAAGQASKIAEETNGELVTSFTAAGLLAAVTTVRRKPTFWYQGEAGAYISVSTQRINPCSPPMCHSNMQPALDGCEDKVIVSVSGIPEFVHEPANITGKVKLDLPPGICQSGPFNCKIRIIDRIQGDEYPSSWYFPTRVYKDISIRAC